MTANGFSESAVTVRATTFPGFVDTARMCSKGVFSVLPDVELLTAGFRSIGLSVPAASGPNCVYLLGLKSSAGWQLPPTGATSVYPYPDKMDTITGYIGDWNELGAGFAAQPGQPVFVSVASNEAPPITIAGVGSVTVASDIVIETFNLRVKGTNAEVAAKILVPPNMRAAAGVTVQSSPVFRFPTSMALVPLAPLQPGTAYIATFQATVEGRRVSRSWEFGTLAP